MAEPALTDEELVKLRAILAREVAADEHAAARAAKQAQIDARQQRLRDDTAALMGPVRDSRDALEEVLADIHAIPDPTERKTAYDAAVEAHDEEARAVQESAPYRDLVEAGDAEVEALHRELKEIG